VEVALGRGNYPTKKILGNQAVEELRTATSPSGGAGLEGKEGEEERVALLDFHTWL
jgi:hypothetical protein